MKKLVDLFERGHSVSLFIEGWTDFQPTNGYTALKAKALRLHKKYSIMFPPVVEERNSLSLTT